MFLRLIGPARRSFDSLSEQEILALAISSEEEDARIYRAYADGLHAAFPASARVFEALAAEEDAHRRRLIDLHEARFGPTIPLLRREHVRGYYERTPDWLVRPLGIGQTRDMAARMEEQAARFYEAAAPRAADAGTRRLLGDLAAAERGHEGLA
nr:rubrerythrin family protein [Paracoccaceae bacterium]